MFTHHKIYSNSFFSDKILQIYLVFRPSVFELWSVLKNLMKTKLFCTKELTWDVIHYCKEKDLCFLTGLSGWTPKEFSGWEKN